MRAVLKMSFLKPGRIGFVGLFLFILMGCSTLLPNQPHNKYYEETQCRGNSENDIMVNVGSLCVDKYEASLWSESDGTGVNYGFFPNQFAYPPGFPPNGNWTTPVYAVSKPGVIPSTNVTWFMAQQACALSHKRLLTNAEWQLVSAGTPDPGTDNGTTDCAVSSPEVASTGSRKNCTSKWKVNDMVGNVWEWVGGWIQGDRYRAPSKQISSEYGQDNIDGINISEHNRNGAKFPSAIIRGGNWHIRENAGIYSLLGGYPPSFSYRDIGFRCKR